MTNGPKRADDGLDRVALGLNALPPIVRPEVVAIKASPALGSFDVASATTAGAAARDGST
jgi:hypothetical protein